jgi:fructokinase
VTTEFAGDVSGFSVRAVDTTGAGDGFVAGMLKGLLASPCAYQDEQALREICRYANAVGALTTMERGAIPSMPTAERVVRFLEEQRRL